MEMTNSEEIGLARPGDIPAAGPSAPPPGGSITIPSLRTRQGVPSFAAEWCRSVPGLPLVPLRKRPPGRPKGNDRAGIVWEAVDPWWERPGDSRDLLGLLKDDNLGIGLRLGRPEAGAPWVVDVLAHKPGVARRQLDVDSSWTVSWEDEEGTHDLYVGDDGLEALGGESGLIVDEARFPGVEIRPGSPRIAGSLCVLPPTPRTRGGRRWRRCHIIRRLPEVLCNRLFESATTTFVGCIESPRSAADPAELDLAGGPDGGGEGSGAVDPTEIVQVAGEPAEVSPEGLAPILPDLAERIRVAHLGCVRSMGEALGYYRQAGEMLLEAKRQLGHGQFQNWVEANCGFSYRTAANCMRVSLNWPEVERVMAANLQRDAPLTLAGLMKALVSPKSSRSTGEGAAVRDTSERDGVTVAQDVPAGPQVDLADPTEVGLAPTCQSASLPGIEDEGTLPKTLRLPGPSTPGTWEIIPAGPTDAPAVGMPLEPDTSEGSSPWLEDRLYLSTLEPIRGRLKKSGKTEDFDADALDWRLLRPIAGSFFSRFRDVGEGSGSFALVVLELVRARPPEEWTVCVCCEGSGISGPGGERCVGCGYKSLF